MRLPKVFILILFCFLSKDPACGQIYAPVAADSFLAAYNPSGGTDMVFVFNRPVFSGQLTVWIMALSLDRNDGWTFQWSRYDPASGSYLPVPGSTTGSASVMDTLNTSSGYRVTMTDGDTTLEYRAWVVFNDFDVSITNKDENDRLQFGYYNCSSLDLRADTTQVPLFYYNPDTRARIRIFNNYTIRWRTDNPEATNPPSRLITRVTKPPSEDTWYILTLTDRFNLKRVDSVFYESIQSKAEITGTYVNLGDSLEYPDRHYERFYNDDIKSAPGKYRFDISASKNAVTYRIDFGDGEILEIDSASEGIVHEFAKPGLYKVVLTTKSEKPYECIDSLSVEAELVYGALTLPNVFSPNNDGSNDELGFYEDNNVFRSEDISVVTVDITIFDRVGTKMHSYSGNMRDWEGWDGKVMHSNREAPEGVYYYVISTLVYFRDPQNPIKKDTYNGFFHLYRQ